MSSFEIQNAATSPFGFFALGFVVVFLNTFFFRWLSKKLGFVSRPSKDRWNTRTVALGGGSGIFLGLMIVCLLCGKEFFWMMGPAMIVVFITGFIDDIFKITPTKKLLGQAIAAAIAVKQGFLLGAPWEVLSIALTIPWIVGYSNALNLSDNMDGLATGIVLISALGLYFLIEPGSASANFALGLSGASLGFLFHNFFPARVFMGDSGSLLLGLCLAALSTKVNPGSGNSVLTLYPLIALVLIVPLFDTSLVMAARSSARLPLMAGGKDHTSHRLTRLGMSERVSVILLYLFGASSAMAAYYLSKFSEWTLYFGILAALVIVTLLWLFILEVKVYHDKPERRSSDRPNHSLPKILLFSLEFFLDVCVVSFSWSFAHYLRFAEATNLSVFDSYYRSSVIPVLPLIIVVKVGLLLFFRMYRGIWQRISGQDVYRIFKANTFATVILTFYFVFADRMTNLSRMVLVLDWAITLFSVVGVRAAMTGFRRWSGRFISAPQVLMLAAPSAVVAQFIHRQILNSLNGNLLARAVIEQDGQLVMMDLTSHEISSFDPRLTILGEKVDVMLVAGDVTPFKFVEEDYCLDLEVKRIEIAVPI